MVPIDIYVVLSLRLGSSSGVSSCGSCILDKFDDATSLDLGKEAAMGKKKSNNEQSKIGNCPNDASV